VRKVDPDELDEKEDPYVVLKNMFIGDVCPQDQKLRTILTILHSSITSNSM
jgi:hypothetical protein